jgi:electron-transferring-flavoprotein dehydrogenase
MEYEVMEFDVLIVGAGPAGLSAACRIKQLNEELSVCVVEKGSEVGAHILSGAVVDPKALNELFPEWKEQGAPLVTEAKTDEIILLKSDTKSVTIPNFAAPKTMHNHGCYIASVGNLARWLAERAEELGVEVFPGFPAAEVLYNEDGGVKGVLTGAMGVGENGEEKDTYVPSMALEAKFTLFSEGCRGHLGKELINKFDLAAGKDPQHYGLGIKELWDIEPERHQEGLVIHGSGWPLSDGTSGGFFLYHAENNQVVVGLIVDLNYSNPWVSPFDEFQRMKHHPKLAQYLEGGKRVSYGARAIAKGGHNCLPEMTFDGGLLIGCDAGTLNFSRIKGVHTAMKSGMLAAESVVEAIAAGSTKAQSFNDKYKNSWLYDELYSSRNFGPALHKFGPILGGAFNTLDQNIFGGRIPVTLHDTHADHEQMRKASECSKIEYPKPDGKLSFDKLSSVFISNTAHEEDQPCHLQLLDASVPTSVNIPDYAEPAQRYCPAGVYEVLEDEGAPRLQINGANCLHCKTCDIKDPMQNIRWVTPEGAGGPNYPNM